jgi:hypothetical protein
MSLSVAAIVNPFGHYRDQEMDFYFQDNIRVNSRLTLNAGLRWEGHPAPYTQDGLNVSFDLAHDAMVLSNPLSFYIGKGYTTQAIITNLQNLGVKFETPQQAGIPAAGFYNSYLNFNPRVGFAYTPFSSRWGTVIRGGYGEYIYPVPIRNSLLTAVRELPWMASWTQSYTNAAQSPDGLPNYLLRSVPTVVAGVNSTNVVDTTSVNTLLPGVAVSTLDPHYDPAHVKQANLTIEQPVKGGGVFRITYLFVHGTDLDQYYQYNLNPSTYVWETTTGTVPPTGTYSSTATRPYDQLTWGTNQLLTKWGFSSTPPSSTSFASLACIRNEPGPLRELQTPTPRLVYVRDKSSRRYRFGNRNQFLYVLQYARAFTLAVTESIVHHMRNWRPCHADFSRSFS